MKRTICLILIFLLSQALSSLVAIFFFNLPNLLQEGRLDMNILATSPSALGISLLINGAVVWAIMTLLRWTDRKSFRNTSLRWPIYFFVVLWMVPVIFIVNLLLETLVLEDLNQEIFARLVYNPWGILSIVLVSPFAEELVFRMGIQRHLIRHKMSPQVAILLSSLLFGIVHGNPAQIPGAVIFGCVLGWLYWKSGTFWLPVVAHCFNNLVGVSIIWCTGDMDTTLVELCGGIGIASICALAALGLVYLGYRYLDKQLSAPHLIEKGTDNAVTHS